MPLSAEKIASVTASAKKAFGVLDKDGSGTITHAELAEVMSGLGQQPSQRELDVMISEMDADGDGEIDYNEFLAYSLREAAKEEEAAAVVAAAAAKARAAELAAKVTVKKWVVLCGELADDADLFVQRMEALQKEFDIKDAARVQREREEKEKRDTEMAELEAKNNGTFGWGKLKHGFSSLTQPAQGVRGSGRSSPLALNNIEEETKEEGDAVAVAAAARVDEQVSMAKKIKTLRSLLSKNSPSKSSKGGGPTGISGQPGSPSRKVADETLSAKQAKQAATTLEHKSPKKK